MADKAKKILPSVKVWDATLKLLKGEQHKRYQETGVEPVYAEMVHAAVELWLAAPPASAQSHAGEIPSFQDNDSTVTLHASEFSTIHQKLTAILESEAAILKAVKRYGTSTRDGAEPLQDKHIQDHVRETEGLAQAVRSSPVPNRPGAEGTGPSRKPVPNSVRKAR